MVVPFSTVLAELQVKCGLPDSVRVFLTTFGPPVRELDQVSLVGENPDLVARVLREAQVVSIPLELNTRAFFMEAQAMYAARLVADHQPKKARVTRARPFIYRLAGPDSCSMLHYLTFLFDASPITPVCASPPTLYGPVFPPNASRVTIPRKRANDSDVDSDGEAGPDVRRKLLGEFAKRFGYNLPVMLQGSDWLVRKIALHRKRKFLKFVSLADIQCAADSKTPDQELSVSKDRLVVRDQKKKYKFNGSALAFLNSIELLLFTYVTVSMDDPPMRGAGFAVRNVRLF